MAVAQGMDIEDLEKMLNLQERWEANEAKKEYNVAMSSFKANPPHVTKDKTNTQYKSTYTSLGNLVNTVNPELSKHGLSSRWDIKQNGTVEVTCIITHTRGHSESAKASSPVDTSGAKNAIQQIKSTITYLKSLTFESVTGLASTDANLDDDGESHSDRIDDKQLGIIRDEMDFLKVDSNTFLKYMGVDSVENIKKSDFKKAMSVFANRRKGSK